MGEGREPRSTVGASSSDDGGAVISFAPRITTVLEEDGTAASADPVDTVTAMTVLLPSNSALAKPLTHLIPTALRVSWPWLALACFRPVASLCSAPQTVGCRDAERSTGGKPDMDARCPNSRRRAARRSASAARQPEK